MSQPLALAAHDRLALGLTTGILTSSGMEGLHSSEEDLINLPQDDLAEAFGTPPTRNNSIKPLRKLSSELFCALPKQLNFAPLYPHGHSLHRFVQAKRAKRWRGKVLKLRRTSRQVLT